MTKYSFFCSKQGSNYYCVDVCIMGRLVDTIHLHYSFKTKVSVLTHLYWECFDNRSWNFDDDDFEVRFENDRRIYRRKDARPLLYRY